MKDPSKPHPPTVGKRRIKPPRPVAVAAVPPPLPHELIHQLVAFVGVLAPDGTLVEANQPALEAGGLRAADVIGKKFWDCFWWSHDPGEQERLRDTVRRVAAGETVRYDAVVRMAQGRLITIDFMLAPLADEHGAVTHLIPSGADITDRVAAERKLAESRDATAAQLELLETVFGNSPMAKWVFDDELRFRRVNARFSEMVGISPDRLLGRTLAEMFPGVPEAEPVVRAVFETGQPVDRALVEGTLTDDPEFRRTWEVSYNPLRDSCGRVSSVCGVAREVTAERQADVELQRTLRLAQDRQAELESLFAVSPAGLCFHDANLIIRYANARLEEINGIPNTALLNRHPEEVDEGLACHVVPLLRGVIETGQPVLNHQIDWVPPYDPDTPHHFLVNYEAVRDADGRAVRGVMAAVVDISEIIDSRQRLQSWADQLAAEVDRRTREVVEQNRRLLRLGQEIMGAQNRERRRVARILHDDLQQTLTAACVDADVLAMRQDPPCEVTASLRALLTEATKTARNLSHELYPAALVTHGLVPALEWLARECQQRYGLTVDCQLDPLDDHERESQAFLYDVARELLFNVHKHSGVDAAQLTLRRTDGGVVLAVEDAGNGCDEGILNADKQRDGDTAGLPLLRHRLELLGGRLHARSGPGRGCRIEVTLPLHATDGPRGDQPPDALPAPSAGWSG